MRPRSVQPAHRGGGGVDLAVDAVRRAGRAAARRPRWSARRWSGRRWCRCWPAGTPRCRRCTWPSPGSQAALGRAAQPAGRRSARPTGIVAAERAVVPTTSSQATISGSASSSSPNRPSSSSSQSIGVDVQEQGPAGRRRVGDELAGTAGARSQVSVVVTTPSVVMLPRSHAIFGAEKYGSSTSPVRCGDAARAVRPARRRRSSARRSCHTIAGDSGRPVPRSQASTVSPWLARATAATGTPACATAPRPALTHRVQQCVRVLLDPAAGAGTRGAAAARRRPRTWPSARRRRWPWCPRCPGRSPERCSSSSPFCCLAAAPARRRSSCMSGMVSPCSPRVASR